MNAGLLNIYAICDGGRIAPPLTPDAFEMLIKIDYGKHQKTEYARPANWPGLKNHHRVENDKAEEAVNDQIDSRKS